MQFKIMGPNGHDTVEFKRTELEDAREKFFQLTNELQRTAAVPTGNGEHRLIREFDPTQEEVLFIPHLIGG